MKDPREEGERCDRCGKRYPTVYSIPDDIWERVKPFGAPVGAGLLCPECVDWQARRLGIFLEWKANVNIDASEHDDCPKVSMNAIEEYWRGTLDGLQKASELCEQIADEAITLNPLHCAARIRSLRQEIVEETSGPSPQYGSAGVQPGGSSQAAEESGTTIGPPAQVTEPPHPEDSRKCAHGRPTTGPFPPCYWCEKERERGG